MITETDRNKREQAIRNINKKRSWSDVGIMEVTCEEISKDFFKLWFVAISGQEGPQIKLPRDLLQSAYTAIGKALGETK
jgi:hypothetical protein